MQYIKTKTIVFESRLSLAAARCKGSPQVIIGKFKPYRKYLEVDAS